jgi:hypothetical protein
MDCLGRKGFFAFELLMTLVAWMLLSYAAFISIGSIQDTALSIESGKQTRAGVQKVALEADYAWMFPGEKIRMVVQDSASNYSFVGGSVYALSKWKLYNSNPFCKFAFFDNVSGGTRTVVKSSDGQCVLAGDVVR